MVPIGERKQKQFKPDNETLPGFDWTIRQQYSMIYTDCYEKRKKNRSEQNDETAKNTIVV